MWKRRSIQRSLGFQGPWDCGWAFAGSTLEIRYNYFRKKFNELWKISLRCVELLLRHQRFSVLRSGVVFPPRRLLRSTKVAVSGLIIVIKSYSFNYNWIFLLVFVHYWGGTSDTIVFGIVVAVVGLGAKDKWFYYVGRIYEWWHLLPFPVLLSDGMWAKQSFRNINSHPFIVCSVPTKLWTILNGHRRIKLNNFGSFFRCFFRNNSHCNSLHMMFVVIEINASIPFFTSRKHA